MDQQLATLPRQGSKGGQWIRFPRRRRLPVVDIWRACGRMARSIARSKAPVDVRGNIHIVFFTPVKANHPFRSIAASNPRDFRIIGFVLYAPFHQNLHHRSL